MELEAEVAKLKEENEELRKKQVPLVVGDAIEVKVVNAHMN